MDTRRDRPEEAPGGAVLRADVIIAGSGAAGLVAALGLAGAGTVLVLTRQGLTDANTMFAQGGIAAALAPEDSPDRHLADTLAAGAGLSDRDAVRALVEEGPDLVRQLVRLGADFDRAGDRLALGREAAHSLARVVHARDATGAEVQRTLARAVRTPGVDVREGFRALDLIVEGGRCRGVLALGPDGRLHRCEGAATILATGGAGQAFRRTTNPEVATGDGIAMAWRAGAEVADLEFVQFHPTVLAHDGTPRLLITEAVRGEGAVLRDASGERFLLRYDPRGELAPRDVVARAIWAEMERTGAAHVWLDARAIPGVNERFPTVAAGVRAHGLDLARDLIPVTPAAHYFMGGVRTEADGSTSVPGLYACGEVACTGVHGANRLASNSLLEALVFGSRTARAVREVLAGRPAPERPAPLAGGELHPEPVFSLQGRRPGPGAARAANEASDHWNPAQGSPAAIASRVRSLLWEWAGIVREGRTLEDALRQLEALEERARGLVRMAAEVRDRDRLDEAMTALNLATVAVLIVRAALARRESRGAHFRSDFPAPAPGRPVHSLQAAGRGLWWRDRIWT